MQLGFIRPTYPGEKKVALLPEHITSEFENELIIETGFGSNMSIEDITYAAKGCKIDTRANSEFYDTLGEYDIIINGIEMDDFVDHIITKEQLKQVKKVCLIIDSVADAGNSIEGTRYMSIANPIYEENGLYFYEINNAPSMLYRKTSFEISKSFSEWVYKKRR